MDRMDRQSEGWQSIYSALRHLERNSLSTKTFIVTATDYVLELLETERARHAAACQAVARGCLCAGEGEGGEEVPE